VQRDSAPASEATALRGMAAAVRDIRARYVEGPISLHTELILALGATISPALEWLAQEVEAQQAGRA
jgi:hypothetical protein